LVNTNKKYMKIIITNLRAFNSKKTNAPYVGIKGITEKGDLVDTLFSADEFKNFKFDESSIMTEADLKEVFSSYKTSEIEYNGYGRVVDLK